MTSGNENKRSGIWIITVLMKMKSKIFLYLALPAIIALSCGKENSDVFIPNGTVSGADTNWVLTVTSSSPIEELQRELLLPAKLDSFEATQGAILQFPEGLQVTVPANACVGLGSTVVTGKIYIEALLVKKKGDMIRVDKPTSSFGKQLISGGEIFVEMKTSTGATLALAPGKKIGIRYGDVNVSPLMRVFYGDETDPERFNWIQSQDSIFVITQPNPVYELQSSKLRWINCDYFADTTGQRLSVHASLAANYTNANTSVYLVYKDARSVLGVYGNASTKKFVTPLLPVGKQVTLVVISKQGTNSFYLGHESFVIGLNAPTSLVQSVLLNPVPTSLADIKAYLSTL